MESATSLAWLQRDGLAVV